MSAWVFTKISWLRWFPQYGVWSVWAWLRPLYNFFPCHALVILDNDFNLHQYTAKTAWLRLNKNKCFNSKLELSFVWIANLDILFNKLPFFYDIFYILYYFLQHYFILHPTLGSLSVEILCPMRASALLFSVSGEPRACPTDGRRAEGVHFYSHSVAAAKDVG